MGSTSNHAAAAIARALGPIVGIENVLVTDLRRYLLDAAGPRAGTPRADAVVRPGTAAEVEQVVRWAYAHDVPITVRGGGTGLAGGAVPLAGGIVLALERLTRVRELEPGLWRIVAEAGLATAHIQRMALETGLFFPPNPGAAEQSQIGGNVATNAGGPRAFKYGSIGAWVTGIEAVLAPGELVAVGGPIRKDVAGYDLTGLLVGSEGTLGVITAAWLRLLPAAPSRAFALAFYPSPAALGCAVQDVMACGAVPAAIEFLDGGALAAGAATLRLDLPRNAGGMLLVELDGSAEEVRGALEAVSEALADTALVEPFTALDRDGDWLVAWRDSLSLAVVARRGAKLSQDMSVPVERLADAVAETVEIGRRHGLEACSWGHAGDGNVHATFLVEPGNEDELARAIEGSAEVLDLAIQLGGSVSGEHGVGTAKNGHLRRQWSARAVSLHRDLKAMLDPKGLLNPGKKLP